MKILALLLIVAAASGNVIDINYCSGVDVAKCTIKEIRVEPCEDKKACKMFKGEDSEISFDFIPNFSTPNLTTVVDYRGQQWDALDSDGCKVTKCPTVAGTMQTYNAKVHIGKLIPKGRYRFDWSVSDANDEANKCCFEVTVVVAKKS